MSDKMWLKCYFPDQKPSFLENNGVAVLALFSSGVADSAELLGAGGECSLSGF